MLGDTTTTVGLCGEIDIMELIGGITMIELYMEPSMTVMLVMVEVFFVDWRKFADEFDVFP